MEDTNKVNYEHIELKISDITIKKFQSFEEVRNFLNQEMTFFSFLNDSIKHDSNLSNYVGQIQVSYNDYLTRIANCIENRSNEKFLANTVPKLIRAIDNKYSSKTILLSSSNDALFLLELHTHSPLLSGYAYMIFSKQFNSISWTTYLHHKAVIEVELYEKRLNSQIEIVSLTKGIEQIRIQTQNHLDEYIRDENALKGKFEVLVSNIETLKTEKESAFNAALEEKKTEFSKFQEESISKLENTNKAYKQLMTLKAPVEYWKDMQMWSYIRTCAGVALLLLYAYFFGQYVIQFANELGLSKISNPSTNSLIESNSNASYGNILFFVSLGSLYVWIMRIFFRYILGQLHIANESNEKMVMTKTYLALLEDGKLEVGERELV